MPCLKGISRSSLQENTKSTPKSRRRRQTVDGLSVHQVRTPLRELRRWTPLGDWKPTPLNQSCRLFGTNLSHDADENNNDAVTRKKRRRGPQAGGGGRRKCREIRQTQRLGGEGRWRSAGAEPRAGEADGVEKLVGTREAACLKATKAICLLQRNERQGPRSASV